VRGGCGLTHLYDTTAPRLVGQAAGGSRKAGASDRLLFGLHKGRRPANRKKIMPGVGGAGGPGATAVLLRPSVAARLDDRFPRSRARARFRPQGGKIKTRGALS